MDKIHIYMCLQIEMYNSTAGNKTRYFSSPFLVSSSRFLVLAEAFRIDHVAPCCTALRSAIEKNEIGDKVTIPCSSKTTQRSGTVDWPKF